MRRHGGWTTKAWLDESWLRIDRGQSQQSLKGPTWLGARGVEGVPESGGAGELPRAMRVEAALVLAKSPLTARRLAQIATLQDATEARTLVRGLNDAYDRDGRAFRVEDVAGGYVLMTRPELAPWLRRLPHMPQPERLTQPALETLSIVAYRQPVLRADIEAVRGVSCGEILRQLMEKGLVKISGRSEDLGRPYLYATSKRFLQIFGLRSTDNLPHADWFQNSAVESEDQADPSGDSSSSEHHPGNVEKESDVTVQLANEALPTDAEPNCTIPFPGTEAADASATAVAVIEDEENEFLDDDDEESDDEDDYEDDYDDEYDEDDFDDEDEDDDEDDFDEEDNDWEEVDDEDDDDEEEDDEWDEEEDVDDDADYGDDDVDVEEDEWD